MSGGGVFQGGRNGSVPGLISIAQNLLNKPAPDTVEFGGTALHDTVGDMAGFYLQFKNGAFWWEGNTGSKPAGAAGAGTRMMWIPNTANFIAARASANQLDSFGAFSTIFGNNNSATGQFTLVHGDSNSTSGQFGIVNGSSNNVSGVFGVVNGANNTVVGTFNSVNSNSVVLAGNAQFNNIHGFQTNRANDGGDTLFNSLFTSEVNITNTIRRSSVHAQRVNLNNIFSSLILTDGDVAIKNIEADKSLLSGLVSGKYLQSIGVGIDVTGDNISSILVGSQVDSIGSYNILNGTVISNLGSQAYLFGKNITNTKDGVIHYQFNAGNSSFYLEMDKGGNELGVGFGRTNVSGAFINYKAGTINKSVQNFASAPALKTTPVTGDFEADANRLYYTKTPGTRETLAYLSDIGATLDYVTFEYNIANVNAIGQILTNQGGGYCITIPFNATIQGVSVIAQTATAGSVADTMTFSVREVAGNGQSGNGTDVVFNSGTQIRTLSLGAGANAGARFNRLNLDATASGTVTGGNMLMVSVTNIVGAYSATNVLFRVVLKRL